MTTQDAADELAVPHGRFTGMDAPAHRLMAASSVDGARRPLPATHDDRHPLDRRHLSAVRDLPFDAGPWPVGQPRDRTMTNLLSDRADERRRAFAEAVTRRWIRRGSETVVWAVILEEDASELDQITLGHRLGGDRSTSLEFVSGRDGLLRFLGRNGHAVADDTAIRREAATRGVHVHGIGTARLADRDDDLLPSADRAMLAARIVAIVPELPSTADISELGPWAMLSMIPYDRSHLEIFSPAAYALSGIGDVERRRTIEVYLDSGCHPNVASDVLHIHRTTLYYRIERMPDVVRDALDDGVRRSALHLCLKLIRLWETPR
jgi:hypothetical protein